LQRKLSHKINTKNNKKEETMVEKTNKRTEAIKFYEKYLKIVFYENSLKIKKKIRDKAGESVCYGNLGVAYYSLGDFKKAIEFLENSLKIKKEIGDKAGESACYTNLGIAYQSLGDSRKAIEFPEN